MFLLVLIGNFAYGQAKKASFPQPFSLDGEVKFVHDPSIIKAGDIWYVFSTTTEADREGELPIRGSKDLHHWKRCGYVFPAIPDWIRKGSPGTKNLWAPDISYFNGEYHLYYAFSLFGKNTSGIAVVTNKTLDPTGPGFRWVDRGLVLRSKAEDDFNAIDPNLVAEKSGRPWLSFGSFWAGIKMRRIDPATGGLSGADTKLYSLAKRKPPDNPEAAPPGLPANWQAIEAPSIVRHDGFYYLFASFDLCCRGLKSTYKTMVGRSRNVTGPYVDENGTPMLEGGGTPVLVGNSQWIGPGGESVRRKSDVDIIVFHAYDRKSGAPYLQLSTIDWTGGWPHAALEGNNTARAAFPETALHWNVRPKKNNGSYCGNAKSLFMRALFY